jgi:hypothetical protein
MKLHIESIEGGIYLASILENDEYKFEQVWLKQNTPYDEMCGLSVDNEKLELLIDWH